MIDHPVERWAGRPSFSLIFPIYNAASVIDQTWEAVAEFLGDNPESWEVLFVCDGCTDGTAERLARLLATTRLDVRMLSYQPNRGKGYAVRRGMGAARGQWRIFTDIDLAYGFDDISRVAQMLRSGAPAVIASRAHSLSRFLVPPGLHGYAWRRHLQSTAFSLVARKLLRLTQHDTQAGLKGFSARTVRLLWPLLQCNGFGLDCELLVGCAALGIPVVEVPVTMSYDCRGSTTGWRAAGRMLAELWTIRRHWLARKFRPRVVSEREPTRNECRHPHLP